MGRACGAIPTQIRSSDGELFLTEGGFGETGGDPRPVTAVVGAGAGSVGGAMDGVAEGAACDCGCAPTVEGLLAGAATGVRGIAQ